MEQSEKEFEYVVREDITFPNGDRCICYGNPDPDPIEHQKGIDEFGAMVYEYIERAKARKQLSEEQSKGII